MIATIESIDFTSWLFRLIGTKKHKHKSATRMGKWAVTFVVLAAALLTLRLYGQQTASGGDSADTDVPVNKVGGCNESNNGRARQWRGSSSIVEPKGAQILNRLQSNRLHSLRTGRVPRLPATRLN